MVVVEKKASFTGHKAAVYALAVSDLPEVFFSAGGDGNVVRWDIHHAGKGQLIAKTLSSIYALHYLPSKNWLVIGKNYEGIHIVDLNTNKEVRSLYLTKGAIFDIQSIGNSLLIATANGQFFEIDTSSMYIRSIQIGGKNLRAIHVLNDQSFLLASSDGWIRKLNAVDYVIEDKVFGHDPAVFAFQSNPSGTQLMSVGRDAKLKFWDITPNLKLNETINAHIYAINDIALRSDHQYFATASMDKTIKVWDLERRKLLKVIDNARHGGHFTSVNKLLWLDANNYLISGSDDRSIGVWQLDFHK